MTQGPSQSDNESELIDRFVEGDEDAFDCLYERHSSGLLGFLLARVNGVHLAEDLSQEIWAKVIRARETLQQEKHFRGWLFQIARNHVVDYFRSSAGRHSTVDPDQLQLVPSRDASDDTHHRDEELAAFHECCRSLPPQLVELFCRIKQEGESPKAVAESVGKTRGYIDRKIHEAKKMLMECVQKKLDPT